MNLELSKALKSKIHYSITVVYIVLHILFAKVGIKIGKNEETRTTFYH